MPVSGRQRDAVKVAQTFMAVHQSRRLLADGRWGSYTQAAYDSLPAEAKKAADDILSSFGTSASELKIAFQAEKLNDPSSKIAATAERVRLNRSVDSMRELVRTVAVAQGVPPDTALRICFLESKFDPNAKSPTGAKGLFQMTGPAIMDVRDPNRSPTVFDLRGKEFDPTANATAGCIYIKIVAKDMHLPLTDAAGIYMGFNIGVGAARKYLAGNIDGGVAKLINMQAYGPPSSYGKNLRAAIDRAGQMA